MFFSLASPPKGTTFPRAGRRKVARVKEPRYQVHSVFSDFRPKPSTGLLPVEKLSCTVSVSSSWFLHYRSPDDLLSGSPDSSVPVPFSTTQCRLALAI